MEKEIFGYENYTVDENGRIFNKKRKRYLNTYLNAYGYPAVDLWKNGKKKYFLVHRLVAEAFIPNPNNYKEINHKDENPANPNVDNLEWCTRKYNNNYGNRLSKISSKVKCVETGNIFCSIREAERQTGIKSAAICMVCNGKRKTAGGFSWRFC